MPRIGADIAVVLSVKVHKNTCRTCAGLCKLKNTEWYPLRKSQRHSIGFGGITKLVLVIPRILPVATPCKLNCFRDLRNRSTLGEQHISYLLIFSRSKLLRCSDYSKVVFVQKYNNVLLQLVKQHSVA